MLTPSWVVPVRAGTGTTCHCWRRGPAAAAGPSHEPRRSRAGRKTEAQWWPAAADGTLRESGRVQEDGAPDALAGTGLPEKGLTLLLTDFHLTFL